MAALGSHGFAHTDRYGFVRTFRAVGTCALHTAHWRIVGTDNIIFAVYLVEVVTFAHCVPCRYDHFFTAFHKTAEVGLHFYEMNFIILIYSVYFPVIVKQDREVVYFYSGVDVLPWSGRIFCNEYLQSVSVDVAEYIKFTVVIADTGSPDSLTICFFSVFQIKFVSHIETVHAIAHEFPVYEILRVENYNSRCAVHGSSCQVEVISYADNIRVGKFIIEQRVGIGPVSIVGTPRNWWSELLCRSGVCQ